MATRKSKASPARRPRVLGRSGSASSLRDVARLAGVSLPTASQALNGRARISTVTRQRVREAARRLRYTPNAAARRLKLGRSNSVAIVPGLNMTGIFSDLFYRAVLAGVGSVFEEVGVRMLIAPPLRPSSAAPPFVEMAQAREVDGILVAGVVEARWVRVALGAGVPVVILDNFVPGVGAPAVVNDNAGGAYAATRHLVDLGHTRIGFVGAAVDYPFGRETQSGYAAALRDAGLERDPALEAVTPVDADAAFRRSGELLALADRPSAIFAVTDKQALGVMRAAGAAGLRIPHDLSVVGMDDIELAATTDPPLTTVRIRKDVMGATAARILLGLVAGDRAARPITTVANELIIRGTTGGRP
ncbi:MAG TPA: LacI family DNA-binding transcriptional regulator [bacterium]|nr:LacI family DNA-binding transcriptional regulator [bacterium]